MTDFEARLRELGERVRNEQRPAMFPPQTMRAANRRRFATALTGLLTVAALVSAGTYAAANFTNDSAKIDPATPQGPVATPILFVGSIDGERVTVAVMSATGIACYIGGSLEGSVSTLEVVEGRDAKTQVIALKPASNETTLPGQDGTCVEGLEPDALRVIVASPERYFLLADRGPREEISALEPFPEGGNPNAACLPPLGFEPGYVPTDWLGALQSGSGTGTDVIDEVVGHYGNAARPGSEAKLAEFFDLSVLAIPYSSGDHSDLEVLGQPASLDEAEGGAWITFGFEGCAYRLMGLGDTDELIVFAEGLRRTDFSSEGTVSRRAFGALWPEDTAREAKDACNDDASPTRTFRFDPMSAALEFGSAVLGWKHAIGFAQDSDHEARGIELRRSGDDDSEVAEGAAVRVTLVEVASNCWSVWSVTSSRGDPEGFKSIRVRGRDVEVAFDDLGADSIAFEMGHGFQTISYDSEPADGRITALLRYEPDDTGHFLLLFKDENGEVFSATGMPLPAGDFPKG